MEMVEMYGRRWKKIAQNLPGRSSRMIRNRFIKLTKQKKEDIKKQFDK